jgi:septal ring factor EnvC (AmiA/AmiB activator)
MLYLILQISFIASLAVLIGIMVGWWGRSKAGKAMLLPHESPEDPFDARFRLEQCHRDNAALRRDLKDAEERAEKLQARLDNTANTESDVLERLETYEIRLQALMEDLQMRDDTIAVLEKELEELRNERA